MATKQKPQQPLVFSGIAYTRECDEVDMTVTLSTDDDGRVVIVSEITHVSSVDSDVQAITEAISDVGETGIEYALSDAGREKLAAWLAKQPVSA